MKRVLICGDRNWNDKQFFDSAMITWEAKHGVPEVIIEGCARGADHMAGHSWAPAMNNGNQTIKVEHFPAMWNFHNSYSGTCWCSDKSTPSCKGAGPLRNQAMLDAKPDAVIAFHKDIASSKGTADMVRRARKAGIPVWIPYPQPQQELDF